MKNLKSHVIQSYNDHPAFKHSLNVWIVPDEYVTAFDICSKMARQLATSCNKKSFSALRNDCHKSLINIFEFMQLQINDEFDSGFLDELRTQCIRLLNEELDWHSKKKQQKVANLESAVVRHSAIDLQLERYYFGLLSVSVVAELRDLAANDVIRFQKNVASGRLSREDLSINSGVTVRAIRSVLNREYKSLGVLDAVSSYTERKMRVTGLALELSVPQATWWKNSMQGVTRPPKTLYAHLDEGISFPKSIVYLSEVTGKNGPTGCYPGAYEALKLNPLQELIGRVVGNVGNNPHSPMRNYYAKQYHQSMTSERFRGHFMRLPASLRFNSHIGWDVTPDSALESILAGGEKKMIGPPGTFIIFDGARLLHRGGLVEEGARLAIQAVFSDTSLAEQVASKVKRILL